MKTQNDKETIPTYVHYCGPRKGIINLSEVPALPINVRERGE